MSELNPSHHPQFAVDGESKASLARDLLSLETHEDELGVRTLEARFANWGQTEAGGTGFLYFDGQSIGLGRTIDVSAGDAGSEANVFSGPITSIAGSYVQGSTPVVTLRAEDPLVKLRMRSHTRTWESTSDADIASRVGSDAGATPDTSTTGPTHTQLWQVSQSDLALLRERARAVDARITLDDRTLRFVPRRGAGGGDPIRLTRLNELLHCEVTADLAHQRKSVKVHGWSVADKDGIHEEADDGALGSESNGNPTGASILDELGWDAVEHYHLESPATTDEARALAEALFRARARGFVRARCITTGTPALRVGAEVELVDLGPWYSGRYTTSSVRHRWSTRDGLRTFFVAERVNLGEGT